MTVPGLAPALFAALALLGAGVGRARAEDKLDDTTAALMKLVEEAAKAKDVRKDPKHGDGKTPFEEAPAKPGILVGFDVYPGVKGKTTQYVRGVRPIFLTIDNKKFYGTVHGWVGTTTGSVRIEAKSGYAVAGLKIHTDFGEIAGLAIVFAKITEKGLNMDDTYDSKYYGHNDPSTAKKAVCTGEPIVGVYGLVADNAKSHDFGLGLVVMGKDKKKKDK